MKHRPDLLGGVTTVVAAGHRRHLPAADWWPYRSTGGGPDTAPPSGEPVELTAIPYSHWANRRSGSMRVWLPTS